MPSCRRPPQLPVNPRKALADLAAADPRMAHAIAAVGSFPLPKRPADLHLLCSSVMGQSISTKAAQHIVGRFTDLMGPREELTPRRLLRKPVEELKALGLTMGKAHALHGLAEVWQQQGWQDPEVLRNAPDAQIAEALCGVKGVGPWTAKMFLMFGLRRPDVFPEGDLGIREGVRILDRLKKRPSPKAVVERAEVWRPWRTVASVYLWQYLMTARNESLEGDGWW